MKKRFVILTLVFIAHYSAAQNNDESLKYRTGKIVAKWSALHFIDHFPSLQIAVEHRVFKQFALQYDVGVILNLPNVLYTVDYNKHGYRAKLQARYYVYERRHWKFFTAAEAGYNQASFMGYRAYYVNPEKGYDYYQFVATPSTYKEKNLAVLLGFRFSAYRFGVEVQVGAIKRSAKFHNDSPGPGYSLSEVSEKGTLFYELANGHGIGATASVRLCYILR